MRNKRFLKKLAKDSVSMEAVANLRAEMLKVPLQPGLLIINEKDAEPLMKYVVRFKGEQKLLGIDLKIIPYYLYDERFLKHGACLLLAKDYVGIFKNLKEERRNFWIQLIGWIGIANALFLILLLLSL